LIDKAAISSFVKAVGKPVNIMARKGAHSITEVENIGVSRVSLGPGPMYASMGLLRRIGQELREKGTYGALLTGALTYDELNALAQPKR